MKCGGIIRHRGEREACLQCQAGRCAPEAVAEVGTDRRLAQEPGAGYGHIQDSGTRRPLSVIDIVGRNPDPALSPFDGFAEAGVEAVTVQVALAGVVRRTRRTLRTSGSSDSSI